MPNVIHVRADLRDPSTTQTTIKTIIAELGQRIDILVNNAGINKPTPSTIYRSMTSQTCSM